MSWKKYFKAADNTGVMSPISGAQGGKFGFKNYQSRLPEVYSGHPNRVNRYNQYEAMDMDSEISACLDIISEFSTQDNDQNSTPFDVDYHEKPTDNEVKLIEQNLKQWCKLNQFKKRIFKLFRNTLKYGDQVFLRDPETFELFWVDMSKVGRVIVNESKGKEPDQYIIQDINPNFENLSVATKTTDDFGITPMSGGISPQQQQVSNPVAGEGTRFGAAQRETTVDAKHIVHLSLTEGLDLNWPFGTSILENIFKVYKQKELLEDAILIYRVQRAPERRVFYIDVGNMPSHMAMSFVERVKNEIHQRRIPTQSGEGDNMLDATYNPLCIDLETRIPLLDGRTLTLQQVIAEYNDGKENWVYSADPVSGKVVPGEVKWAGETRKNTEVLKLHLDNGETLTCTPDHKIPVLGKGFVEAKDLSINDSLISFEHAVKSTNKMTKLVPLRETMDTGCLNVDNEYHTFAIESGIYIKNSMQEDYFFPQSAEGRGSKVDTLPGGDNLGCFALDTKVKLLDNRNLSISEIEAEMKDGNELWAYSCDPITGKIVPGLISWAGKTRSNAKVLKIVLDNGEEIVCTPDHKIPLPGIGFVEAKDLTIGQSLIPLYTKNKEISKHAKRDYEMVYDNESKKWVYTHRLVAKYMRSNGYSTEKVFDEDYISSSKNTIHHKDFNRYNNSPANLTWMNFTDHTLYHQDKGFSKEAQALGTLAARDKMYYLKEHDPEQYNDIIKRQTQGRSRWYESLTSDEIDALNKKRSVGVKKYYKNLTSNEKEERKQVSRTNWYKGTEKFLALLTDDTFRQEYGNKISAGQSKSKVDNPELWKNRSAKITEANIIRWQTDGYYDSVFKDQKIKFNSDMYEFVSTLYVTHKVEHAGDFTSIIGNNSTFMQMYAAANTKVHSNTKVDKFSVRHLHKLLKQMNHTWESFKLIHSYIVPDDILNDLISQYDNQMSQYDFISKLKDNNHLLSSRHKVINHLNKCGIDNFKTFKEFAEYKNHRIVDIIYLDDTIDVGTLSIDQDELHHDYHTFALSAGVFVKNSINDLLYFNNKLARGLRVPSSYLPSGPEDNTAPVNDGRLGTALIQEYRFNQYCIRLQNAIGEMLNKEFKMFLAWRGFNIDASLFDISFGEPQNFASYRQTEQDASRVGTFASLEQYPYLSKRFLLERYLGLSEEDMTKNDELWAEENKEVEEVPTEGSDLRGVGVMPGGMEGDIGMADDLDMMGEMSDDMGPDGMEGDMGPEAPVPPPA